MGREVLGCCQRLLSMERMYSCTEGFSPRRYPGENIFQLRKFLRESSILVSVIYSPLGEFTKAFVNHGKSAASLKNRKNFVSSRKLSPLVRTSDHSALQFYIHEKAALL